MRGITICWHSYRASRWISLHLATRTKRESRSGRSKIKRRDVNLIPSILTFHSLTSTNVHLVRSRDQCFSLSVQINKIARSPLLGLVNPFQLIIIRKQFPTRSHYPGQF